jgi:hypothetical protein
MDRRLEPSLKRRHYWLLAMCALTAFSFTGCTAIMSPIDTIPADMVPPQFLADPQANKDQIDLARLRREKPENYILDSGDILGVYLPDVWGSGPEGQRLPPPIQQPAPGSDLPPSIGYPIVVREDGTIALPLIEPISVRGLTINQVSNLVKRTYKESDIFKNPQVDITMMRERSYRVFVIRQDNTNFNDPRFARAGQGIFNRSDLSSRGFVLQMPEGRNDVLNALTQTGGLPGVTAKSEIRILRGSKVNFEERDEEINEFYQDIDPRGLPFGILPTVPSSENEVRIPLRLGPGEFPIFSEEDITLRDGDVVFVDSRESEVYYTGGLLGGGEFPLPRDYDLDVLGAVAVARGQIGNTLTRAGGFVNVPILPPGELIVLRRLPGNRQIAIKVDLTKAVNDPRTRILVKAGDTLILRHRPSEEVVNFGINTFFTFGVRELFRN